MRLLIVTLLLSPVVAQVQPSATLEQLKAQLDRQNMILQDWADLARYREENRKVPPPTADERRVVFLGDSITDRWGRRGETKFFPGKPYLNRGIGGQTTQQMLLRFQQDVVALRPKAVVILAGTNDLAGNSTPEGLRLIEDDLRSMAELGKANGIEVILSSITPDCDYYNQRTTLRPPARIMEVNKWIREYSSSNGLVYLDYYPAMLDSRQVLSKDLTADGLHPNDAGYAVMAGLAEKAIVLALKN